MKHSWRNLKFLVLFALFIGACEKEKDTLPSGPIELELEVIDVGPASPSDGGCARVTIDSAKLKATQSEGFFYWGTLTNYVFPVGSTTSTDTVVTIQNSGGNAGAGTYLEKQKPYIVPGNSAGRFSVTYTDATIWALDSCSGCIGMESYQYKEYKFFNIKSPTDYSCGRNYQLYLKNKLFP
jgi:hypothetical protein